ncbi:MAG: sugar phosphate nucleotidyltransferase, partial [Actinomycetota bacterium]|nr:sugar phosphate nucleotidyltransferase [Actinomycetota bacterium]
MRAVLLAAGLGTRLRPLTDKIPKCLVPIKGKPLLDIWCESLLSSGVEKILINLHYKHEAVEEH